MRMKYEFPGQVLLGAVFVGLAAVTLSASAFKLRPEGTTIEGKIRALDPTGLVGLDSAARIILKQFSSPVHEQITNEMFGCLHGPACAQSTRHAPQGVIAGVRWNDNPAFSMDPETKAKFKACKDYTFKSLKLPNYSECWVAVFKAAERGAGKQYYRAQADGGQYLLLNRVHFGDMQFLHSMGSWNGEKAADTKASIMMWAEFTYRLSLGDISPDTELRKTGIKRMDAVFRGVSWTSRRLFALGDSTFREDAGIRQMALGSLLHMVQDSFSMPHVERESANGGSCSGYASAATPGQIRWFHAYNNQDSGKHGQSDSGDAFEAHYIGESPDVVDVGKVILREYREGTRWEKLAPYFDCLYTLTDDDAPARSGTAFERF